jgi:hypothetical protein
VDVEADILADLFPDDVDQEFGVLVTTERRVFTFVLFYGRGGDLNVQAGQALIREWSDITAWWQASLYQASITDALHMLDTT